MAETWLRIRLRAFDHRMVDAAVGNIVATAQRTGAIVRGPIPLPTKRRREDVLISPHVNKDARDQFQLLTHQRLVEVLGTDRRTIDALKNLNLSAGVGVNIEQVER